MSFEIFLIFMQKIDVVKRFNLISCGANLFELVVPLVKKYTFSS